MSRGPSFAIVTPSFNQAAYLEAALRSVLDQDYAPLEYVVMDGGSTDGSAALIERYNARLTAFVSQPDPGQYAAVAASVAKTRGEIIGWLNSDAAYVPGVLENTAAGARCRGRSRCAKWPRVRRLPDTRSSKRSAPCVGRAQCPGISPVPPGSWRITSSRRCPRQRRP